MDLLESNTSRLNFEAYINELVSIIGHADRAEPLHDYCTGLLLPGERKSVEPMAALTAPARTAPKHQSLLHFVANAPWSDEAVLTKIRQIVLPKIEALGPIEAVIVDDTGFPKKGKHSVGVARQYCGQLGKQDNCQAVVSLSLANHHASLPKCRRTSSSRPNQRSRWTSCGPLRPPAFRSARCWPMPATATTASSAMG
jgi:SRSO17 transposase